MQIVIAVFLAAVQGITEFLPISSSAHLFLFPWIFNFTSLGLAFDAAIHVGTAAALLVFFWKDFWNLIKKRDKLLLYILIASVPAAIAGFVGDKFIEETFHRGSIAPLIIGIGIIFFGGLMYYVDHTSKLDKDLAHIGKKKALFIGLAQALALIPGTSRSGITITAGEFLGLNRESAARFSFLLATPISMGAGLYKLLQLVRDPASSGAVLPTIIGIVVSFLVGMAVIAWLLEYLRKHSLLIFVIYRFILGALVVALWFIRR